MNLDLQSLLEKYIGNNPATYMVLGVATLIVINLIVTLWLAARSNTLQFHLLGDFVVPTTTHALFLITMGVLTFSTKNIPLLSAGLGAMQALGFGAVMISYTYQIYNKLKQLGMPIAPRIDEEIQSKFDTALSALTNGVNFISPIVVPNRPVVVAPIITPAATPTGGILVDSNHTTEYVPPADAVLEDNTQAPPAPTNAPEEDGR